ncbi:unnamed protein product [Bursaphelenchus okinawaensis]|uniref:Dynein light chain Tctex-type 1 n=1 Tax=Bursaphelenchus okinawaensis TaxID=465554 RepID=A0A811JSL3_9BILA|nr:unnamed protein product [Bursaphelenchus okinawaensis]CAG9081110.1 unnamed protein product [Bursaphelenchus okinawaensis]
MVDRSLLPPSFEEVSGICKEVLDDVIGQKPYQHAEVVKWNQTAVEKITEKLAGLGRPYKYCLCCVVMQTGLGAGLNVSSTCYWDKNTDHTFAYRWESRAVIAVCNVYAISMSGK